MQRPKILDPNEVNKLNGLMSDSESGKHFIIFWEYNEYNFAGKTYCNAFLECVLALYRLYVDCGGSRLKYCLDQRRHGKNDILSRMQKHYYNVCNLRTFFSHNLYLSNSWDSITYDNAQKWFYNMCGIKFPTTEDSWRKCYNSLVAESNAFYQLLFERINFMIDGINKMIMLEEAYKWYSDDFPEKLLYNCVKSALYDNSIKWSDGEIKEFINNNVSKWKAVYKENILYEDKPYLYLLSIVYDDVVSL